MFVVIFGKQNKHLTAFVHMAVFQKAKQMEKNICEVPNLLTLVKSLQSRPKEKLVLSSQHFTTKFSPR